MKNPRNAIDRFCRQHPNFGIPNLMKYVTIANVVFWLISAVNPVLMSYLTFNPALILRGQVWRLVTFALYPPSMGILAFIAFYFYYMIGTTLEQYWGTAQFNIYFFSGIILTVLYGFLMYFITGLSFNLTAQYVLLLCGAVPGYAGAAFLLYTHKDKVSCLCGRCYVPYWCAHGQLSRKSFASRRSHQLPHILRR